MAEIEDLDLVVLGSGEAGKYLAWAMASEGKRAAVVERRYIGGSCPNIACLPTKNVIHSAKVAAYLRRGPAFGLPAFDGPVDMAAVRSRKRAMVDELVAMHLARFESSGAELVMGNGRFLAPRTIEVALHEGGTRLLRGAMVIVSTGSRAKLDATPGLREARPLTHVEALELDRVPNRLVVLGGGYVGLETAQAFRRLGSEVAVVERHDALIHNEDPDVTTAMEELLREEGIEIHLGASVERVQGTSGASIRLFASSRDGEIVVEGTDLLVAGGRTPNTDGIGLDAAGVEVDEHGHVRVDAKLRTTADGVWAVGDCAGSPHFTHVALDDFRVVQDDLRGGDRVTTGRLVPFCLFTDPELARVGLSEREARNRGVAFRLAKIPMLAVLRTRTLSETRGFMKALVEAEGDRILGFTAFGVGAGEVVSTVQMAMIAGLPFTAVRDAVLTHPTIGEGLGPLFQTIPRRE